VIAALSDLVTLVRAPNPSPITLEGTNTYIVGSRTPVVIDPGPNTPEHLQRVLDESGQPSLVVLTHGHPDHAEGAETFAAMARAPLAAFGGGNGACATAAAITDGHRIDVDGTTLVAMHTPGHASDHLSFVLEAERTMFTGDHVLGRGTTVVAYPDGDMADYMASLRKARAVDATRLYPGHGPTVEDPAGVLDYYIAHRLQREAQVLEAIDAGAREVVDMVARIYADVDPHLHAAAALSVQAHLRKLVDEGVLHSDGGTWHRP
jgi:glyoxylase-like metal-dependent hydrolase (beta-lactamase superfamily II)